MCRFTFAAVGLLVLASSLALPTAAQSPLPFSPLETPVPDGVGPPLGFGDVDGDGSPDLIVHGVPYVLLNDGHGRFTPAVGSAGYLGSEPTRVIADFNGDGRADLLTAISSGMFAAASLWFGTASGTLVSVPLPPTFPDAANIAAGDVDGDGDLDVVCARRTFVGGQLGFLPAPTIVMRNDGSGNFTNAGALGLPDMGGAGMAFVDFDQDGDQDLGITGSPGVAVAINNGGTFAPIPNYFGHFGSLGFSLFNARVNADIHPDFVIWRPGVQTGLYLGGPAGVTASPASFASTGSQIAIFDFTGDGIDEIVLANDYGIDVYSLLAPAAPTILFTFGRPGGTLLTADFDGDADLDMLLWSRLTYTAYFSDGAGALHPQGPGLVPRVVLGAPIPLDLNGDGAPELVGTIAQSPGAVLAIAQNDGTGRFAWTTAPVAGSVLPNVISLIVAPDVQGDGLKDLVLVEGVPQSTTTWSVSIRLVVNGGGGTWTAGPAVAVASAYRFDAASGDLNGDGYEDVVLSDYTIGVRVLFGHPGGLLAPGLIISPTPANRIALFDADGDLDLDVAVAGAPSRLLVNDGSGSFTPDPAFPTVYNVGFVTAGDVDGNGSVDVNLDRAIYLQQGGAWTLLGNLPPGPIFGGGGEARSFDFDFDGDVDTVVGSATAYVYESAGAVSTHPLALPSGYGYSTGWKLVPADLDRDGDLDLVCTNPIDQPQNMPSLRLPAVLYNTSRQLAQNSPARPGRPLTLGLHGSPGGLSFVYASSAPASIAYPPFGTLFIDPAGAILLGSGAIPASGTALISIPIPPSASAFVGSVFELQGFVDTAAGPRLTNARHVKIVSF